MTYPKRRKPARSGIERIAQRRHASHLGWIRGCMCIVGVGCEGRVEAAHVRNGIPYERAGGAGLKPGDEWTVPLCAEHHREQHAVGETAFAARYRIDLVKQAEKHAAASPHLKRLARKMEAADD